MNEFNPGDGWREVEYGYELEGREHIEWHSTGTSSGTALMWIREVPVPPLPTEPGYYVDAEGSAWRLDDDGEWDDTFGNPLDSGTGGRPEPPLVRYEPRAVTAKAVLDRVREQAERFIPKGNIIRAANAVGREFGVAS